MTPPSLSLEAFLCDLTWTDSLRHKLRVMADRDDIRYLVAWRDGDRLACKAFAETPRTWPNTAVAIWDKRPSAQDAVKSKTMQALARVLQDGLTPFAAAKEAGINASAVYRALARQQTKPLCPCCGQVVRDGFSVDQSVLKAPSDAPTGA